MNDLMNDSMHKSICCYTTQMMMNLNYFVSFTNMWVTHRYTNRQSWLYACAYQKHKI